MRKRGLGLTRVYNLVHDPNCREPDIQGLRELQIEMDRSVADAYGWADLELGHDFHEHVVMHVPRFTLAPKAQTEALRRLLRLNQERATMERDTGRGMGRPRQGRSTMAASGRRRRGGATG